MVTYPIRFSNQLREHLRALRKKQGLTQAQLGSRLGVSQARIAEIEANPGVISVEQLLQLLAHLGSGLLLEGGDAIPSAVNNTTYGQIFNVKLSTEKALRIGAARKKPNENKTIISGLKQKFANKKGSW